MRVHRVAEQKSLQVLNRRLELFMLRVRQRELGLTEPSLIKHEYESKIGDLTKSHHTEIDELRTQRSNGIKEIQKLTMENSRLESELQHTRTNLDSLRSSEESYMVRVDDLSSSLIDAQQKYII